MGAVIYSTIGLAMDLATLLQTWTAEAGVWHTGGSALLNLLVILSGGAGFLHVPLAPPPPVGPRPNPPSPA